MRHPEFPVVSFLCVPFLLCSLPSHLRAGSISTIAMMTWLVVMSVIRGVNTLVWADNVVVRLETWCDITTKITIGFTYAVPAASLCILRHLENVASTRLAQITLEDKRRRQIFETAMCFGIPIVFMALHYIVQGHRFDLIEDFGCSPAQYISVAAVFILWIPPLSLSIITMIYAAFALRHLLRHRISFATHLRVSQSAISPARYFRLMALGIVEMAWDAGTNIYLLYFNISVSGLRPWISWENVHSNFSRIAVFPTFVFPSGLLEQFIWQWWIIPVSCLLFFIFFGLGEDALADYRMVIVRIHRTILPQHHDLGLATKPFSRPSYRSELVRSIFRGLTGKGPQTSHGPIVQFSGLDSHISRPSDAVLIDHHPARPYPPSTHPTTPGQLSHIGIATCSSTGSTLRRSSGDCETLSLSQLDMPSSTSFKKHSSIGSRPLCSCGSFMMDIAVSQSYLPDIDTASLDDVEASLFQAPEQ